VDAPWWQKSIPGLLGELAVQNGSAPAVGEVDSGMLSFAELMERATDFAASLVHLDIAPGDRVALLMAPTVDWAIVHYGIMMAGAVVMPINLAFREEELADVIAIGRPAAIIVDARHRGGDALRRLMDSGATEKRHLIVVGDLSGMHHDLHAFTANHGASDRAEARIRSAALRPSDPCCLINTSGSTGKPKPALIHHRGIIGGAWYFGESVGMGAGDRLLVPWPTYHVSGFASGMLVAQMRGLPAWLMHQFDPGEALRAIAKHGITTLWGFDTTYAMLLAHPDFNHACVSTIRRCSMATRPAMIDRVFEAFPNLEITGKNYSMTETSGPTTVLLPSVTDRNVRKYSHGKPLPGVEVRVVDPRTEQPALPGQSGEIRVRGWNLFLEYFDDAAGTSAAFDAHGFFRTGDIGRLDTDGVLYFDGRYKRLIKTGGENVSEAEVEGFIEDRIKGVKLAQVVGVPDELWGEAIIAFVELFPGSEIPETELIAACKAGMANFKAPKRVFFLADADWPRNEVGKISKDALIAEAVSRLHENLPKTVEPPVCRPSLRE
jgi:fatty-acyl-CoA synthase